MKLDVVDNKIMCPVHDRCSDIEALRESSDKGTVDEELADQFYEVCTTRMYEDCGIYKGLSRVKKGSEK